MNEKKAIFLIEPFDFTYEEAGATDALAHIDRSIVPFVRDWAGGRNSARFFLSSKLHHAERVAESRVILGSADRAHVPSHLSKSGLRDRGGVRAMDA